MNHMYAVPPIIDIQQAIIDTLNTNDWQPTGNWAINDDSGDFDGHIETDNEPNMLAFDAGLDELSIGGLVNRIKYSQGGTHVLEGTARLTRYEWMPVNAIQAAGIKPATQTVNGNGYPVYSFADNQDKEVQLTIKLPETCDTSEQVSVCVGWSSPTADPGDNSKQARWQLTYLVTAEDEATDAAGTAAAAVQSTASQVADGLAIETLASFAVGASDVCIHCKIERIGSDILDTLGDVAELHGVALIYTANKYK